MAHKEPEVVVLPPNTAKIKKLWQVAAILGAVTGVEFAIAFAMEHGPAKTSLFVLLTIVKAGYIVGEFMHLKYEVKLLFWAVLIPMIFVVWMLVVFVFEGTKIIPL
jgi:cytochrome c oxidase subunit 4